MGLEEDFKAAADLAASGANDGLKKISQDQQLKLYGWFKQVELQPATARLPPRTYACTFARTHARTHAYRRRIRASARCRKLASATALLV